MTTTPGRGELLPDSAAPPATTPDEDDERGGEWPQPDADRDPTDEEQIAEDDRPG